jgi:biotin carboxyl carrier protein
MKKYVIRVNGKAYDVEVEEIKGSVPVKTPAEISSPPSQDVRPKPDHSSQQKAEPVAGVLSGSNKRIVAPMTGTIVKVFVEPGDTVDTGDVLLVLEAMKMENDVIATIQGKVDSVHVTEGTMVNASDMLITLK